MLLPLTKMDGHLLSMRKSSNQLSLFAALNKTLGFPCKGIAGVNPPSADLFGKKGCSHIRDAGFIAEIQLTTFVLNDFTTKNPRCPVNL